MLKSKKIKAKKIKDNDTIILPSGLKVFVSLAMYFKEKKQMWINYYVSGEDQQKELLLGKNQVVELVDRLEKFNAKKAIRAGERIDYAPPKNYESNNDFSEVKKE